MAYPLYNLALNLAAPFVRHRLKTTPGESTLLARFEAPAHAPTGAIWMQACSVGEVNTAAPLVEAFEDQFSDTPLLVTASTATGHARARARFGDARTAWFPFDTAAAVRAFYDAAQPRVLILVETELWPNVIAEAARRAVPVVIVNGRLSEKHFQRYRRARPLLRAMFSGITRAGMQSAAHATRIEALGVPGDRISVTGNLKFDAAPIQHDPAAQHRLRAEYGFTAADPVLVFGSTRPGDEALASACWTVLREDFPRLKLIIAPRHLERIAEAAAPFGGEAVCRSAMKRHRPETPPRVVLVDSLGELVDHYAIATLAVIGGSFYPGVGGHNPLEAAGLGIPVVYGKEMQNFEAIAADLLAAGGAVQPACAEDLCAALHDLIANPGELARRGTAARRLVLEGRGAAARNVALVQQVLDPTT